MRLPKEQHEAWVAFFVGHGLLTKKIEHALAVAGCPGLEVYDVLLALEMAPDQRLRMSDLANAIVYSRSGLTRLVDRLERLGWIRRERCPQDRRSTYAVLTDAGLAARESAWPVYRTAIQEHFGSRMSAEEARTLAEILGRFAAHPLSECGGAADPHPPTNGGTVAPRARG
ncbi:MAG: MarR family transcriptional regulator [Fimbriimonadaceae bacterium]|nr:MarR family transcriptional regulator [Fimbriimonadaceae bacterium]